MYEWHTSAALLIVTGREDAKRIRDKQRARVKQNRKRSARSAINSSDRRQHLNWQKLTANCVAQRKTEW